jgi:hypothetical protein
MEKMVHVFWGKIYGFLLYISSHALALQILSERADEISVTPPKFCPVEDQVDASLRLIVDKFLPLQRHDKLLFRFPMK